MMMVNLSPKRGERSSQDTQMRECGFCPSCFCLFLLHFKWSSKHSTASCIYERYIITADSPHHCPSFYRALQEAQEIFGGDFDFADFDADAYDQGEEEEEDQDEESWDRPKKQTKRRLGRKSIFEIYEPSELESSHMTDQDNEIRSTDMPERFQVCLFFLIWQFYACLYYMCCWYILRWTV